MIGTAVYVPVPTGQGYCVSCRGNVAIDTRGRCHCGELAIWPEGRPRPAIVTEELLKLRDGDRVGGPSVRKSRRQLLNLRQRRSLAQ